MRALISSVALAAMMITASGCATSLSDSLSGNYCTVAPDLTPKAATFDYIEANDPVLTEQIYQHWALAEACE